VIRWLVIAFEGLGLVEEGERHRWDCRHGRHSWGLWQCDTTMVPLYKIVNRKRQQVGWEAHRLEGPTYHYCSYCPAMERKV